MPVSEANPSSPKNNLVGEDKACHRRLLRPGVPTSATDRNESLLRLLNALRMSIFRRTCRSFPPEAPAWKDKIPFRTSSSEATAGTTDPSGGPGKLRFSGAEGCFSFKGLSLSPSWDAKPSAEASSLTAPLTSPSTNLAATLLLRVSSPSRAPYLGFGVACTSGRFVLSISWAACCLTPTGLTQAPLTPITER